MADVKKLTAGFLVIAGVVSLVAFALSSNIFSGKTLSLQQGGTQSAAVPAEAFAAETEGVPSALQENLSGAQTNLTVAAADNVAQVLLALNPTGPQTVGSETGLIIPTTTILASYLAEEDPQFDVSELWSSPADQTIEVAGTNDATANQAYVNSFQTIMKGTVSSPAFVSKIQQEIAANDTNDFLNNTVTTLSAAIQQLQGVPVPQSFAQFDKDFLVYLENQRNVMAVVANNVNDPIKSLIVLQSGPQVEQQINDNFSTAVADENDLNLGQTFSQSQPGVWSTLATTLQTAAGESFSIPTANAQSLSGDDPEDNCASLGSDLSSLDDLSDLESLDSVPVADQQTEDNTQTIGNNTSDILALLVYECQNGSLTQQSKANEVNILNATELNSIQNNGDPQFITNYAGYFQDAADQGATQAYKQVSGEICPQFQPYVDATVFSPATDTEGTDINADIMGDDSGDISDFGDTSNSSSTFGSSQVNGTGDDCGIENDGTDIDGFYNNFNSDPNAWTDYFNIFTNPNDNLFGSILEAHDQIDGAAEGASAAANTESIANQGYKPTVECDDSYVDADGNTICDNTTITTPGNAYSSLTNTAVSSGYASVLNSNDISDLDSELANSFGAQLLGNPSQGLMNLNISTQNNLSNVCKSLASTGNQTAAFTTCSNMVGEISADFNKYMNIINSLPSVIKSFQ